MAITSKGSVELGQHIRALRLAKRRIDPANFTGRQFSIDLGISPTYLSKIESGELPAGADLLKRMAIRLDANVDEMLAMGNKIDPALQSMIVEQPNVMATLLRTTHDLTPEQMAKIQTFVNFVRQENPPPALEEKKE